MFLHGKDSYLAKCSLPKESSLGMGVHGTLSEGALEKTRKTDGEFYHAQNRIMDVPTPPR